MTTERGRGLILRDGAGSYYLIPHDVLELHRMPPEQTGVIEDVIGADVRGFTTQPHIDPASPILWQVFPLGSDLLEGIKPRK